MRSRGPSPLVPSLMVGVLGLVILGPTLLSILEFVLPLFQAGDSDSSGGFYLVMVIVLLSLLVLVQLLSIFFPAMPLFSSPSLQQTSSSAFDDGFGLGTILLLVLFLVLYNFLWVWALLLQPKTTVSGAIHGCLLLVVCEKIRSLCF